QNRAARSQAPANRVKLTCQPKRMAASREPCPGPARYRPPATVAGARYWAAFQSMIHPVRKPATAPPRLPIVFMAPDTMPEYLPTMSWQLAQAEPIVRSFQNAAREMAMTKSHGSEVNVLRKQNRAQTPWPMTPNRRRPHLRLPV